MEKKDTKLEVFSFGNNPDDRFYCLVDRNVCPDGLDVEKMKLIDPRNFDQMLREMGCLAMLTEPEVNELAKRGELEVEDLHSGLFELCKKEGMIRP
jgi:hypothetical protein